MGFLYNMNNAKEAEYASIGMLILASGMDERSSALMHILKEKQHGIKKILLLKYDEYDESLLRESFPEVEILVLAASGEQIEFLKSLQAYHELFKTDGILIDITSIRIPEMFMLLKYIRLTKATEKVFIAYSTPMEYEFQEEPFTSYRSYYGNLRTTDLLGYGGMSDDMAHSQLIVFIGFEGILSAKVNEDVRYAKLKLVNNIPSFYEKYKDISIINNYDLLATRHEKQAFVPADNPFETYNFLSELLDDEEAACIAPLSSKPVALGVCMYALDHENIRVVYPMAESYSPHRANSTHSTYMFEIKIN